MFLIYLLIGAIAGFMSGLFGIGGGIIVIPALAKLFSYTGIIPASSIMHMAIGTSLAAVIFTTLASIRAHHKRLSIHWDVARMLAPGLAMGAILGAAITSYLPSTVLRILFAVFLLAISVHLFFRKHRPATAEHSLSKAKIYIVSFLSGGLASMLGVGGGILLVPFLLHCRLDMRGATGTSVVGALVISIVATSCFILTGLISPALDHVPWSTGYVYWPAFLGIILTSIAFAPLGASLAHKLPREILQRVFAVFILFVACDMLFVTR